MQNDVAVRIGELSDHDLLARLKRCVAEDREVTARLLEHFAEVDTRGLFRDQGFSSMFEYAVHGLHMSESEAGLRITVSRLVRQFPQAREMLGRGELHLTALRLLAPRLTAENQELLHQARFKTKQEVQALITRHFPQPDVSDSIRRVPVQRSAAAAAQSSLLLSASPSSEQAQAALTVVAQERSDAFSGSTSQAGLAASVPAVSTQPRDGARSVQHDAARAGRASVSNACVPLSEGRFKVQFTVGQRLHDKLKQAQELMRHHTACGDLAVVLERAVDLLLAERKKQLFGKAAKPRGRNAVKPSQPEVAVAAGSMGSGSDSALKSDRKGRMSRYVPRAVRREVADRAREQCTFVAPDGHRCTARGRLELDHRVPHGRGGPATTENLRVLCRSHNLLMAERIYGRAFMRERIESTQQTRAATPPTVHDKAPHPNRI